MSDKSVARRYSQAFFELGKELDNLEELHKDFNKVIDAVTTNEELKKIVEHKLLAVEVKSKIFREIFSDKVNDTTLKFLLLLIQKKREYYIEDIYELFVNAVDEFRGYEEAEVTTVVDLDENENENLKKKISKITGKKIRLKLRKDPEIIGGMIVKIGDKVIDGSVKTKLSLLNQHLQQTELA